MGMRHDGLIKLNHATERRRWKADSSKARTGKSKTANFSVVVAPYVPVGNSPGASAYVGEEAGSSGSGSSFSDTLESESEEAVPVRRELTNRRRGPHNHNHRHPSHYRRPGGNRRNRVAVERHDDRGGSGSRGRRSRRRRRD